MKIGFKDFWIELTKEDKNNIDIFFNRVKNFFANKIKSEFTIAFIDERYFYNGYICSYSKIKIPLEELQKILLREQNNYHFIYEISDLFTKEEYKKYVLFNSGELNGYELDTPDSFDIYIN